MISTLVSKRPVVSPLLKTSGDMGRGTPVSPPDLSDSVSRRTGSVHRESLSDRLPTLKEERRWWGRVHSLGRVRRHRRLGSRKRGEGRRPAAPVDWVGSSRLLRDVVPGRGERASSQNNTQNTQDKTRQGAGKGAPSGEGEVGKGVGWRP